MRTYRFYQVIKSMIEESGGSINRINLEKFTELISDCFMYNPWNSWLGVVIQKNPLDLMILQEIMFEKRPDTIIECGTYYGGLAYYMATLMDLMKIDGKIIAIDHNQHPPIEAYEKEDLISIDGKIIVVDVDLYQQQIRPKHPKIEYIHSDCLTADISKVKGKTMVILDSDNSAEYVYKELERFSEMVSIGQYIIVENTINTISLDKKNGPAGAIKRFLKKNKNFIVDESRERFGISSSLGGHLLKVS